VGSFLTLQHVVQKVTNVIYGVKQFWFTKNKYRCLHSHDIPTLLLLCTQQGFSEKAISGTGDADRDSLQEQSDFRSEEFEREAAVISE
jgi:hypothetical protein